MLEVKKFNSKVNEKQIGNTIRKIINNWKENKLLALK